MLVGEQSQIRVGMSNLDSRLDDCITDFRVDLANVRAELSQISAFPLNQPLSAISEESTPSGLGNALGRLHADIQNV